jgi:3',5'-cyclic AMP phosphodiesterase CpdA
VRTTLDVTIQRDIEPVGRRVFSRLVQGPGEPHQWRDDLGVFSGSGDLDSSADGKAPDTTERKGSQGASEGAAGLGVSLSDVSLSDRLLGARALLRLVHITDTHVIDASSPARAEFVELAAATDSRWDIMVPMFRPQELLQQHALAAMVDTINALEVAPVSGDPIDVVIVTGDCVDNAQRNELNAYLALFDGGTIHFPYDGVQSVAAYTGNAVGDLGFWCPDPSVDDHWKRAYGFPSFPGLLEAIDKPIVSGGLNLPWLGVVGNHDWLRQGTAKTSDALEAIAVGSQKATGMPIEFLPEDALVAYLEEPASYNVGATTRVVQADADRVGVSAADFIRAHIESESRIAQRGVAIVAANAKGATAGLSVSDGDAGEFDVIGSVTTWAAPTRGHGFGADLNSLRPDYVADFGAVRIIAIDTNHPAGHYQGSVGLAQLAWLEERLFEAKDVYVLLASHHPTEALTNQTKAEGFADDRVLADPVAEVLHRHPCVIGWLTGHRHHHRVNAHRDPLGVNPGFWEITTSSIIDWPSQARILEVLQLADGQIVLASTILDHHGSIAPGPNAAESLVGLAGAHREIAAANAVQRGEAFLHRASGRTLDRNVILPMR